MTDKEQGNLDTLNIRVGNLEKGQEKILKNDLPHLKQRLDTTLFFIKLGFTLLGVLITAFGVASVVVGV